LFPYTTLFRSLRERRRQDVRLSHHRSEPRVDLPDLPRERRTDAQSEPAEADEEDRGDEHVRHVDPAGDVLLKPRVREALGELPGDGPNDEKIHAESGRENRRPDTLRH